MGLEVGNEHSREGCQELACLLVAVYFVEVITETCRTASLKMAFLLPTDFTPSLGRLSRLRIKVESADLLRTLTLLVSHSNNYDVLDDDRDDLLACPEHFGFHDSRRHSPDLLKEVLLYRLPHADVDKSHGVILS
jgi:hypothetical protein